MAILALDLASKTGWALHSEGMERPFFDSIVLRSSGQGNGVAAERLRTFIAEKHELFGLTDIVFEAQHVGGGINPQTAYLLIGLGFMAEWIADQIGARCFVVDISTWRKTFLGKGNYGTDEARRRSIDRCRHFGWHVPDHDAAAACGVLDHYVRLLSAKTGYVVPWRDADFMQGVRT